MIYLIITACINNNFGKKQYDVRKNNYITSINKSLSLLPPEIKPIIVENSSNLANGEKTYLDDLKCEIMYTDNNKTIYKHKGFNELLDIKHVINKLNIQDEDTIIKLTGRYHVDNDTFFKFVINNTDNYDAFIKFFNVCTLQYMNYDCVLGMFAIKCKYLKKFEYIDISKSPEIEFATFVKNEIPIDKIYQAKMLHLTCCFCDNFRILNV
jgi:hypothetical protein